MKIDLHTHILPRDWPDLDAKYGYPGFVRLDHYKPCCARMMIGDRVFREITDNVWDPKQRLEEMDREKITMQVLSTVPVMFSYWAKPHDALDLSRRLNDHIAGLVRDHPKRFTGLATIPLQDPDLAAQELERCVRELGLRGAQIGTHVDPNPHSGRIDALNLDNASLQPVWSAAQQLHLDATGLAIIPTDYGFEAPGLAADRRQPAAVLYRRRCLPLSGSERPDAARDGGRPGAGRPLGCVARPARRPARRGGARPGPPRRVKRGVLPGSDSSPDNSRRRRSSSSRSSAFRFPSSRPTSSGTSR